MGRRGLPARSCRRADRLRRAHRRRCRCLRHDDIGSFVQPGPHRRGRPRRTGPVRRDALRPTRRTCLPGGVLAAVSWVLGPVTWLAQLPFVVAADCAGRSGRRQARPQPGVAGLIVLGPLPVRGAGLDNVTGQPVVAGAGTGNGPATAGGIPPVALPFTVDEPSAAPTTASVPRNGNVPTIPRPTRVLRGQRADSLTSPRTPPRSAPFSDARPRPRHRWRRRLRRRLWSRLRPWPRSSPVVTPSPGASGGGPPPPTSGTGGPGTVKPGKRKGNGKGNATSARTTRVTPSTGR